MDMLILRRHDARAFESAHFPIGTGVIEALVQDLSPSDVLGLARDEGVLASAPSMPLSLIAPVSGIGEKVDQHSGTVTWGVHAVGASTSPFTGKGVTVAVLDTGIDTTHSTFLGTHVVGRNFTAGSPTDYHDAHGHGTHCAATLFGKEVAGTRIGVAPGISKAVIGKVLGPAGGSTGTLFSAINWAIDNGARIISMSLGMDFVGLSERLEGQGMHKKQAASMAMGILVDNIRFFDKFGNMLRSGVAFGRSALIVAASGNESDRSRRPGFVLGTAFPAATEDFLSVAALEQTGDSEQPLRIAPFSNAGAKTAGPGVDVVSAARGVGLRRLSGTSMATPHVAGVAALWAQKLALDGPVTVDKLRHALHTSARPLSALHEADVGYGMPQAPQS
jgi:subtilisin family serine protease